MMRIVCPNCGEEPKKGERHICAPPPALSTAVEAEPAREEFSQVSGVGVLQRRGMKATPNAVCGSMASLVRKSPGLWRSTSALARCGGEAFVAGWLAAAISSVYWSKDPKAALINVLNGRVADEAARAIQDCWRKSRRANAVVPKPVSRDGYRQLVLAPPKGVPTKRTTTGPHGRVERSLSRGSAGRRERPPPLTVVLPRNENVDPAPCEATLPPAHTTPEKQLTPRNKSNPRPNGIRGVPLNPIQALKQRRALQEKETTDKRQKDLLDAESWRLANARGPDSMPSSPQDAKPPALPLVEESIPSSADTEPFDGMRLLPAKTVSGESTPHFVNGRSAAEGPDFVHENCMALATTDALEAALTPFERRNARQAASSASSKPPLLAGSRGLATAKEGETQSAPTTLQQWRPEGGEARPDIPRASSSMSPARIAASSSDMSATTRLKQRLRERSSGGALQSPRSSAPTSGSGWQDRIEARQREAEELQEMEVQHKMQTEERCCRRNDALRKVMERQAQRKEAVEGLQEGLEAC